MSNLTPTEDTYWFVYDSGLGILHTGLTEPGQVTSTAAGTIEHGDDVLEKIEKHKSKLRNPVAPATVEEQEEPEPGFYVHKDKVVLLKKEHCVGKPHLYKALEDQDEQ